MASSPLTAASSRALLIAGVVITASAAIALLVILVCYGLDLAPPASVYFMALWGFPAGFTLMIVTLLLTLFTRRRSVAPRA